MKKRLSVFFDTEDPSSMLLYCIIKQVKSSKRMEVLADNILSMLEDYKLLSRYGDDPAALARMLMAFSENYRADDKPLMERAATAVSKQMSYVSLSCGISNVNVSGYKDLEGTRVHATELYDEDSMADTGFETTTDVRFRTDEEMTIVSEAPKDNECQEKMLDAAEYEAIAVEIAKEYIFSKLSPVEQKQLQMQWAYMDEDELYSEIVEEQLWFENQPENLPEGFESMVEYTEHEMNIRGYKRKAK